MATRLFASLGGEEKGEICSPELTEVNIFILSFWVDDHELNANFIVRHTVFT